MRAAHRASGPRHCLLPSGGWRSRPEPGRSRSRKPCRRQRRCPWPARAPLPSRVAPAKDRSVPRRDPGIAVGGRRYAHGTAIHGGPGVAAETSVPTPDAIAAGLGINPDDTDHVPVRADVTGRARKAGPPDGLRWCGSREQQRGQGERTAAHRASSQGVCLLAGTGRYRDRCLISLAIQIT